MDQQLLQMMKQLTDANGIGGNEEQPRRVMKQWIEEAADEVTTDRLGSLIAKKSAGEGKPRVLIAGHLDEVGFMVTNIDEKGFIKFSPIGGWWGQVMLAQRVTIETKKGRVYGIIGSKPPHIMPAAQRKVPVEIKDMFIDIGAANRDEVLAAGVLQGDMVVPHFEFFHMANEKYIAAKAWDNRIGCVIATEVLRRLKDEQLDVDVYAVGTVQEEIGARGAKTSVALINPDLAFAIDVSIAGDTPGVAAHEAMGKLGEGPQLSLFDSGMIGHVGLREFVQQTAEEVGIRYQFDALAGGATDAEMFHVHGIGVPSLAVGIPTRYIHSHGSIIHYDDVEATIQLFVTLLKRLDKQLIDKITFE